MRHELPVRGPDVLGRPLAQTLALPRLARSLEVDAVLATAPTTSVRRVGAPLCVVVLDLRHELRPEQFSRGRRLLRDVSYGRSYAMADAFVAISQRSLDDLHRLHPSTASVPGRVVHLGGDHVLAWPAPRRTGPSVGFAHHSNKNPDLLFEAWALLAGDAGGAPPLKLLGVGSARREAIAARVAALGLSGVVELAPFLPDEEFHRVFAEADLVVFPSDFEGFGLPVVEGMLLGKPVVLGPEPATTEVAGGHAAVAAEWTAAALADAVRRARAMTAADLEAARAWAATFTWERTIRQTREVLAEMSQPVSRLPHRLQPLWPVVKRLHRWATGLLGAVFRRTSRLSGRRALPSRATARSVETAARDHAHVTLHPGGPAEELVRSMPVGEPAGHAAFEPWLRRAVSARYVLDVRGGLLVGDYAATIAPGGVLDYETSGYFGISGWRQHPVFLRPRLPSPTPVPGTLLSLATRGTSTNYYHFLLDLLPRWGIFEEALPGAEVDAVYLGTRASYQRQLLDLVGLSGLPVVEVEKHACLAPERLLVPSTPNQDLMAPHWVVSWLRARLPASPDLSAYGRGLYVTRGSSPHTRRYVEEAALWPTLEERGFTRLDPGTVSVQEQIDHFAAADVIVAPHGAALANLVFCRPGVRVLELFAPDYVNPCYWAITDAIPDARYRYLVAGTPSEISSAARRPMTGVLRDISIPPSRVLAALDRLST